MKIVVIIPTLLKSPKLLERCLRSLSDQSLAKDQFHLVLVSNMGIDKLKASVDQIGDLKFDYTVLGSDQNLGYTGAVNLGITSSIKQFKDVQFFVTLNDDVWLDKNCLSELVATQNRTQADMIASTIYTDGTNTIDSCGIDFAWRGQAWPLRPKQNKLTSLLSELTDNWLKSPRFLPPLSLENRNQPFGPDAAVALYTKKLFDQIGLFDHRFFAYLEDVDLALRARTQGLSCSWATLAIAYHHKHATSGLMGKFKQKQDVKNWWRIVLKYPLRIWLQFWPQILVERCRNLVGLIK